MIRRGSFVLLGLLWGTVLAASDCAPQIAALEPDELAKVSADDRAAGLAGIQRCDSAEIRPGIVVVAYTASDIGAVRVIRTATTSPTVLYEVPGKSVGGRFPSVRALDVDGDHSNEAVVAFGDSRGTAAVSIYRWDGTELVLISPSRADPDGESRSTLTDAAFLDLDGRGPLAVVDHKTMALAKDPDGTPTYTNEDTLYTLRNGSYDEGHALLFFRMFMRGTGAPSAQQALVPGADACVTSLVLANGEERNSRRVSGAEVTLNGATIVRPDRVSRNVRSVTVPITLQRGANALAVKLAGDPGGTVTILVPACR